MSARASAQCPPNFGGNDRIQPAVPDFKAISEAPTPGEVLQTSLGLSGTAFRHPTVIRQTVGDYRSNPIAGIAPLWLWGLQDRRPETARC
jgi:hypothetical protein